MRCTRGGHSWYIRTFCLLYVDDLEEEDEVRVPCGTWGPEVEVPVGWGGIDGSAAGDLF